HRHCARPDRAAIIPDARRRGDLMTSRRSVVFGLAAAAVLWPIAPSAQQKAMPVIGYLIGTSPGPNAPFMAAFRQGLSETGYIEGQYVAEYRWAEGRFDRLPALVTELKRELKT